MPPEATKPNKTAGGSKESFEYKDSRTPIEKQYEAETQVLRARVSYLESLKWLKPFLKKMKLRELKYKAIMNIEHEYPVWLLCEIAEVSRSSYYKYKKKPLKKETEIDKIIVGIYNKSNIRFGYSSIKYVLKNKYNLTCNHKKIQRIMNENDIHSIINKKFKKPKEQKITKENILNRDFNSDKPGRKFATDITYIPAKRKMIYLCTVIDLLNNEPVAWNASDTPDKNLSIDTIKLLSKKFNLEKSIIYSVQGVLYTNKDYVELLKELRETQSMSRKGNCWDVKCC